MKSDQFFRIDCKQNEVEIESAYHFLSPFPGTTIRESIADYDLERPDCQRVSSRGRVLREDPGFMAGFQV